MRIALAITGASGVRVGLRVAQALYELGYTLEIVVTRGAEEVARHEEGLGQKELWGILSSLGRVYSEDDYTSPLASSSGVPRHMAIVPASMKTVAMIASGLSMNLVSRAALAVLRLGGILVVAPRETPLGVAELRNMLTLAEMGARIVPLCPGFYTKPASIDDIIDFLAGKVLDALGVEHQLYKRWGLD